MKILIVDDSKTMRMIVKRTLKQAGFSGHDFQEAGDGKEALDVISESPPDLILCDWNMPNMSGIELLERLKVSGTAINFVFVTSEASEQMRDRAREVGAASLIAKPFNAQTFQEILGPLLS